MLDAAELRRAEEFLQDLEKNLGGWPTLPRGTGLHPSKIETRGVPDPFLP